MGVATLPSARRQGLGGAVTAALVDDARDLGLSTVFLTASSPDVARIYAGIGFRPVGTGWVAERRPTMADTDCPPRRLPTDPT